MRTKWLLTFLLALFVLPSAAQLSIGGTRPVYDNLSKTYMLTVPETVFGGAYQAPVVIDADVTEVKINGQDVTDGVTFPMINAEANYTFVFKKNGTQTQSSIHFTYLPIMCITGTFSNNYVTAPVQITMPDGQGVQSYRARIKQAGSSTNGQWIHKRNYHVKFVDENGEKMDVSFFGFRSDNHWRLDAGTRDMIRFRNYAANALWADFGTRNYYADQQPKARSYIRGSHVEVFMNGTYHGFYNFSEFMDRKQMKLKKYGVVDIPGEDGEDDQTMTEFHGFMWKATASTNQTLFLQANAAVDNTKDTWGYWSVEYPDIDEVCPTDYSILVNAVRFVATSSNATFAEQVGEYFDLPVFADYYMFLSVVFGIDNAGNNQILACYDAAVDKKLTLAVWDLDATVGQHYLDTEGYYHADEIQPENELEDVPMNMCSMPKNRLYTRLKTIPLFKRMVVNRYWQLRETILQPDSLVERYCAIFQRLDSCGALDREAGRWYDINDIGHRYLDFDGELEYLCDWLRRRIAFLDTHTFACLRGDINGDGEVDIADVTMLISYVLSNGAVTGVNHVNADFNADNDVDISDITSLIGSILRAGD